MIKKLDIHIIGMYLNDIITELQKNLALIRKQPKFSSLPEKVWLAYQLDYIRKIMGHTNLRCVERGKYFVKLIQQSIGYDEIKKYFTSYGITCFDKDGKMRIFYVFTPTDGGNKIIYMLSDDTEISPITQNEINTMLNNGMWILSKTKREEYLKVLSGDSTAQNKQDNILAPIQDLALLPEVMKKHSEAAIILSELIKHSSKERDWIHD